MPISRSKNKIIGITIGDPAGIGPEVTAKALKRTSLRNLGQFKVIGSQSAFKKYSLRQTKNCSLIDIPYPSSQKIKNGAANRHTALASLNYLNKAVELLRKRKIDALVTAPISKEAVHRLGVDFPGHTEYLARAFRTKNYGMMFVSDKLRTIIVTRHVPVHRLSRMITSKIVYETIKLTHTALKKHFRIKKPTIAVCGLNPHAGEGGTIGREEITKIIPAMKKAKKNRIDVRGPFAADTLFSPEISKDYDAVVAMYHDQGLIPVKTLYFSKLVNLTIGLPFIRTSPAHGTAFDIAGKNKADPSSMCEAIKLAAKLSYD